jgi:hypothetical protein
MARRSEVRPPATTRGEPSPTSAPATGLVVVLGPMKAAKGLGPGVTLSLRSALTRMLTCRPH